MNTQEEIRNEQVNDVPLLLGIMEDMGIRQQIDLAIERHGNWQGLSIGAVVEIWLSYVLTEQDHRLVGVRADTTIAPSIRVRPPVATIQSAIPASRIINTASAPRVRRAAGVCVRDDHRTGVHPSHTMRYTARKNPR